RGSTFDAVSAHLTHVRRVPGMRFLDGFHDDPGYIQALARNLQDDWVRNGRPDHLILSFHGLPRRTLKLGDPYHCHCHATARLLAREAGLEAGQWTLAFQSRFGRARRLEPYTVDVVQALGQKGLRRGGVDCRGVVSA